jgi:hypothetical protein
MFLVPPAIWFFHTGPPFGYAARARLVTRPRAKNLGLANPPKAPYDGGGTEKADGVTGFAE